MLLSLSYLNVFTAATPDSCASSLLPNYTLQTALDEESAHAVKISVGSKAEDAGHDVVILGVIRRFSFKSLNDEGGDVKQQTVVGGSCE